MSERRVWSFKSNWEYALLRRAERARSRPPRFDPAAMGAGAFAARPSREIRDEDIAVKHWRSEIHDREVVRVEWRDYREEVAIEGYELAGNTGVVERLALIEGKLAMAKAALRAKVDAERE